MSGSPQPKMQNSFCLFYATKHNFSCCFASISYTSKQLLKFKSNACDIYSLSICLKELYKSFLKLVFFITQPLLVLCISGFLEPFLILAIFHGAIQILKQLPGVWDSRKSFFLCLYFFQNFRPMLQPLKQKTV